MVGGGFADPPSRERGEKKKKKKKKKKTVRGKKKFLEQKPHIYPSFPRGSDGKKKGGKKEQRGADSNKSV